MLGTSVSCGENPGGEGPEFNRETASLSVSECRPCPFWELALVKQADLHVVSNLSLSPLVCLLCINKPIGIGGWGHRATRLCVTWITRGNIWTETMLNEYDLRFLNYCRWLIQIIGVGAWSFSQGLKGGHNRKSLRTTDVRCCSTVLSHISWKGDSLVWSFQSLWTILVFAEEKYKQSACAQHAARAIYKYVKRERAHSM